MLGLLKELISRNPFVEEVDFTDKQIQNLDNHVIELLGRFTELKRVSSEYFGGYRDCRSTCQTTKSKNSPQI